VILWRARLRIREALALGEADLDHRRGTVLVRDGAKSEWTLGLSSTTPEIIETVHARRAPMTPRQRIASALTDTRASARSSRKAAASERPFRWP
jgi:integrase